MVHGHLGADLVTARRAHLIADAETVAEMRRDQPYRPTGQQRSDNLVAAAQFQIAMPGRRMQRTVAMMLMAVPMLPNPETSSERVQ